MTDRRGFLWASAICIAAGLACAGSCAAWGAVVDPRCPTPHGPHSQSARTLGDAVCMVDHPTPGKYELYFVGINVTTRLSHEMPADRDVIAFSIARNESRVAFLSDRATWTKYDLYSVPVTGGVPVKLNSPLPVEHDVAEGFLWSGSRIVYRQGRNTTGLWELFSVPGAGGSPVRISQPGAPGSGVQPGFQILDGERVRYAFTDGGVEAAWYVVPVTGGRILRELFADGFESGVVTRWQ